VVALWFAAPDKAGKYRMADRMRRRTTVTDHLRTDEAALPDKPVPTAHQIAERIRSGARLDNSEKRVFNAWVGWVLKHSRFAVGIDEKLTMQVTQTLWQNVRVGQSLPDAAWAVVLLLVLPNNDDFERVMRLALAECSERHETLSNERFLAVARRDRVVRRMMAGL
jgi:hypothetical protein